jgi:hypothetical protein
MKNYGVPDQNQGLRGINSNVNMNANVGKHNLEKYGPNRENLKVLHKDGSFADLPDREIDGAGAQSGSITK